MEKEWINLLKTQPIKLGIECGFRDLTELNNEWLKTFLFAKEDVSLQAHRGSYKTTVVSLAMAILAVTDPLSNILFFRKTDTDVAEVILQVKNLLESDVFQTMAWDIYKEELGFTKETATELDTNLSTGVRGASQILGLGIKSSVTGKHGDIIFTDDIVNIMDRISKAERERTRLQYQEMQNIKNRGGRIINTGTPWHVDDAFELMPNVQKYSIYDTGMISKAEEQDLRDKMTTSLFAANYELRHIADEDAMFKSPTYTQEDISGGVAHIDASYGGADGTAYTIMKKDGQGGYIAFGKRWSKHVDDCLGEIQAYHEHFKAGTIYLERNADKGYLSEKLINLGIPAVNYHESQNKFIKISTHLRGEWSRVKWIEDTDPEYINEILDYTEQSERDDCPDSAASLIRELKTHTERKIYSGRGQR